MNITNHITQTLVWERFKYSIILNNENKLYKLTNISTF